MYNLLLVRKGADYFNLVCEGEPDDCFKELSPYYEEIRFRDIKDPKAIESRLEPGRHLGSITIRACWFSRDLRPLGENDEPCLLELDPRHKICG